MDDKVSGPADILINAKAPQNPFGRKTKGLKAAVAKLLTARNGNNVILPCTHIHSSFNQSAPSSYIPIPSSTTHVPPFGQAPQVPMPTTPGLGSVQQRNQYTVPTMMSPTANGKYARDARDRGTQHRTPTAWQVPQGYGGHWSGQQGTHYPMPTQLPQVGSHAGHPRPTPAQVDIELSAKDIGELEKLRQVRGHTSAAAGCVNVGA